MPQKVYLIESEDEVIARNSGYSAGEETGYKKGFQIASILWIFILIFTLFFTLDNNYKLNFLHEVREKVNNELKAKMPAHNELIDAMLPDGSLESKLAALQANRNQ